MLDAVYNFVNSMIEESTYYSELIKKHFNKELVMTIKDDKDIKNSVKRQNCDNTYVHGDVKERDLCHITRKYRDFVHRDCNNNGKSKNFCYISQP